MCCDYRLELLDSVLVYDSVRNGYVARVVLTPIPGNCDGSSVQRIQLGYNRGNTFTSLSDLSVTPGEQEAFFDFNVISSLFYIFDADVDLDLRLRVICTNNRRRVTDVSDVTFIRVNRNDLGCQAVNYSIVRYDIDYSEPGFNYVFTLRQLNRGGRISDVVLEAEVVSPLGLPSHYYEKKSFNIANSNEFVEIRTNFAILDTLQLCCGTGFVVQYKVRYNCSCIEKVLDLGVRSSYLACYNFDNVSISVISTSSLLNTNTGLLDVSVDFNYRYNADAPFPLLYASLSRVGDVVEFSDMNVLTCSGVPTVGSIKKSFPNTSGDYVFNVYTRCYDGSGYRDTLIKSHRFEVIVPSVPPCCDLEFINYRVVESPSSGSPTVIWVGVRAPLVDGKRNLCSLDKLALLRFYLDYIPRNNNPVLTTLSCDFNSSYLSGDILYFRVETFDVISTIRNLRVNCKNPSDLSETEILSRSADSVPVINVPSNIDYPCGNTMTQSGWGVATRYGDNQLQNFTFNVHSAQLFRRIRVYKDNVLLQENFIADGVASFSLWMHKSKFPCNESHPLRVEYSYVCGNENLRLLTPSNIESLRTVETSVFWHAYFPC
jgi:hypothetical protein